MSQLVQGTTKDKCLLYQTEMTLRPNNNRTIEEELSSQVTYGYWSGEIVGLDRLRAKTQRELE